MTKHKLPRLPRPSLEELRGDQRVLAEQILAVSKVGLGGPYTCLLRSPVLGQRMFDVYDYLRWKTSVPHKLNEFAILIVARKWQSQIEWYVHSELAARAGLARGVMDDLLKNMRPAQMQPDEAIVFDFVDEMLENQKIRDETYEKAKWLLGEQAVIDLTVLTGLYVTAAMLLALAEEKVPAGETSPFQ